MTALIVHGTAARLVIVAICVALVAVCVLAILVAVDWVQEKIEDHEYNQIHDEFKPKDE